jgi:hypothetical protein
MTAGARLAGMAVLGWHHVNAAAYYSFDCYAQVAADLCTWTVVGLALAFALDRRSAPSRAARVATVALFVAGLLIKEQVLASVAGLAVVALWFTVAEPVHQRRGLWTLLIAIVVAGTAFAWLRAAYGVTLDTAGAASLCWQCVPGNMALVTGGLLLPVRTLEVYLALIQAGSDLPRLIVAGAGAATVTAGLVFGLAAYPQNDVKRRRVPLLVALVIASFFPTALLAHVGELYAHTAVFWFALLAAYAVDGLRLRARAFSTPIARALAALGVAYAIALYGGLRMNLADMRATGERAAAWLDAFRGATAGVPDGSTVLVRGLYGAKGPGEYGLYRLTSAGPLLGEWGGALTFVAPPGVTLVEEDEGRLYPNDPRLQRRLFVADFSGEHLTVREATAGRP